MEKCKGENNITDSGKSSWFFGRFLCCVHSAKTIEPVTNDLLSEDITSEKKNETLVTQKSSFYPKPRPRPVLMPEPPPLDRDREQKDKIVKTILSKYLAIKREESINEQSFSNSTVGRPKQILNREINIECLSSDSSETLILDHKGTGHKVAKLKSFRPKKCKSAPTTSVAHDSLADICFKMSQFKQLIENKSSDSYITCCSNETAQAESKKLELIFKESSDEMSSPEDNSALSLQYEITYEHGDSHTPLKLKKRKNRSRPLSKQSLPSAVGEIGERAGSGTSLKWKLIISQHSHGDFK